ncbi:GpE family phage tail protein, partial [Vibrio cholerae]
GGDDRSRHFFHQRAAPDSVDEAWADIAAVFHWPPEQMDGMDFDELMRWRELAIERFKAMNQVKNQGY